MTNPQMKSAFHGVHGGSPKHDSVPELFESGWSAAMAARAAVDDDARDEAFRRFPQNHIVDDPFGATGEAESDPYGYNEEAAKNFMAGAEWQASRASATVDHAALIAEARSFFCWPEESSTDELGRNLANALEAADARNTELEAQYRAFVPHAAFETVIAERDAALAVIERVRAWDGRSDMDLDYILDTAPYATLAGHDRVIADEALGAALEAWRLGGSGDAYQWLSAYRTNHRANPEPKEADRG